MRVLNPVVTVLILGILSFKLVEGDASNGQNEFSVILMNECEKYGGRVAYDTVIQNLEHLSRYIEGLVHPSQLVSALHRSETDIDTIIHAYCHKVPDIEMYVKSVTDSMKSCVKSDEHENVDTFYNMTSSVIDLACYKEGKRIKQFTAHGGVECMAYSSPALDTCWKEVDSNYNRTDLETDFMTIDNRTCTKLKRFEDCVVKSMQQCRDQTPANIMESVFELYLGTAHCENFLDADATASSTTETWESNFSDVVTQRQFDNESYSSFEEKCQSNGGPTAHAIALESMEFYQAMIRQIGSPSNLNIVPVHAQSNAILMKMMCHRAPILAESVKYLTRSVGPCLEAEEREFLGIVDNVTSVSLEFVCHNEGERLLVLLKPDITECQQTDVGTLVQCARVAFGLDRSQTFDGSQLLTIHDRPLLLRSQDCNNLDRFEQCSVEALAACGRRTSLNLLTPWLDSVKNMLPCNYSVQTETPSSTVLISSSLEQPHQEFDIEFLYMMILDVNLGGESAYYESAIRKECEMFGGSAAYKRAKDLPKYLINGAQLLTSNLGHLYDEVTLSRSRDELNIVSTKYCHEVSAIREYMDHVADTIKLCSKQEAHRTVDVLYKTINFTLEYVCQNRGDHLASFMAARGVECFAINRHALRNCFTWLNVIRVPFTSSFVLGVEECNKMKSAQHCIVGVMATCEDEKPASMINDFIDHVFKVTPCHEILREV